MNRTRSSSRSRSSTSTSSSSRSALAPIAARVLAAALASLPAFASLFSPAALQADCPRQFQRGDTNADERLNLTDAIATLAHLFQGGAAPVCLDAADADDNGGINLADPVYTVRHLFMGGAPLPRPVPGECGPDATPDDVECAEYAPCPDVKGEPCADGACCGPDEFCSRAPGECDEPGECAPRPEFCPEIFDPVCGCDGITYSNPCEADRAGVSVLHSGDCRPLGPCSSNDDCGEGEYCLREFGSCDGEGICDLLPDRCTFFFDPVCGCDGVTYDNICLATLARVTVASPGPCPGVPACGSNEECGPGKLCARRLGLCDEPGFCRDAVDPAECAGMPEDPVCGCDGVTYANGCLAAAAGVGVRGQHPCEVGVPCTGDEHCEGETFCNTPHGLCGEFGTCTLPPSARECEVEPEDPVCGCDDTTYRTYCDALAAGASVAYSGPCDDLPRCDRPEDCVEDHYCAYTEGWCSGRSICEPRPAECPEGLVDPICGCDKRTYVNECVAAQGGVSIAYRGPCEGEPGPCSTNADCGGGQLYCARPIGACEGAGECALLPEDCGGEVDPVCGCDGITYDNECLARQIGVNVLHAGPCGEER